MGVYNSVFVKCPKCGELNEEQYKPGGMSSYDFPEEAAKIPIEYLRYLNNQKWVCYNCDCEFLTKVNIEVKISNPEIVILEEE